MDIKLPDGQILQNVPDGTSQQDLINTLKANNNANWEPMWKEFSKPEPSGVTGAIEETAHTAGSGLGHMIKGGWKGVKDVAGSLSSDFSRQGLAKGVERATSDIESEEAQTYQPTGAGAQAISGGLAKVGGVIQKGAQWAGGKVQQGATALGAAPEVAGAAGAMVETAAQALPFERIFRGAGALGKSLKIPGKDLARPKTGFEGAPHPAFEDVKLPGTDAPIAGQEKADLVGRTQKLGLALTPQQAGGPVGRMAASMAGRPQLEREIAYHNAEGVLKAAGADVGLKDVNKGSVQGAIKQALVKYAAPRQLGRMDLKTDAKLQSELDAVADTSKQEDIDFPEDRDERVAAEIKKFRVASADSDSVVNKIRKLRERAGANFRGNAEDQAVARAQKKIATAMEDAIERHGEGVGRGDTIKAFREARTQLAKLYTLDEALTENGYLDLDVLRKDYEANPKMLTGNFKTLAQARKAFAPSFQVPDKIREHPVGMLDMALGIAGGAGRLASGDITGLKGVAAGAARPLTRKYLRSKHYQRKLAPRPKAPTLEEIENPQ